MRIAFRRIAITLCGTLLLTGAVGAAPRADIEASPVLLDPNDPDRRAIGRLEYLAGYELASDAEGWGSLSGMILTPAGDALLAVSDLGFWVRIGLRHDDRGRLIGVDGVGIAPLLDEKGRPLDRKRWSDAEAVARDADGSLLVAFERRHRLWRYAPPSGSDCLPQAAAVPVPAPDSMDRLPGNGGVEAVAVLAPGRILMLSERGRDTAGDIRGWIGAPGQWAALGLSPTDGFMPTDLAVLPDGDLLLLERRFSLIGGPAARLSILPAAEVRPGARLTGREIAELVPPLTVDNFEALAARPAPDGGVLVYLLSDDNGNPLQRTLLLQFRLPPLN